MEYSVTIKYLEKIDKINNKTSKLLKSNLFLYLTIIVFLTVAFIQLLLYGLNVIDNADIGLRPERGGVEDTRWFAWMHLSFQLIAGFLSILLHIKIQKRDNNWIWFAVGASLFYLVNAIILRIWFSSMSLIVMLCIRIYQHKYWNNKNNNDVIKKTSWKFNLSIILGSLIIALIFGYLMSLIPRDSFFRNKTPYLDAVSFIFLMITQYFLVKKNIFVHFINIPMLIINIGLISVYGQWMTVSKTLITLITVILGMISWQSDYYHQILKNKLIVI